jgi:hypothetical protein
MSARHFPIGVMGTFEHEGARTKRAVFPLMVHDEMVTERTETKTPPPCKQRAKSESPMGEIGSLAIGTFEV